MDILDIMDLLDVGHHFHNNTDSSLLDDAFAMEPNNLSQSVTRDAVSSVAVNSETAPEAQPFSEGHLELKLPILSSSSSDSEPEDATIATAATSAGVEGERAASPPPNCAICLGRCKNKCFTDSCMHQFCFKCLCEWSKVKPECPLCKQTFKSIIHNVKSLHQFEEYHVQPPTVQIAHPDGQSIFDVFYPGHNRIQAWNGSTIRPYYLGSALSTASGSNSNRSIPSSANSGGLRNQYVYRGELLDLYRQEYPGAIANSGTLSQLWRRYVYDRKLYALPVADITGRFRESSARFYRDNPSQIHRLMPWINRDIVCLLRQSQHDVTSVLESINSALTLMNILSPAFRRRLQPILGNKTAHFIHELNNFARSPYDMIGYDRAVQYSPQTNNEEIVIEFSSSDESTDTDQVAVAGEDGTGNAAFTSRSRSTNSSSTNGGLLEHDDVGSHHRVSNTFFNPFTAINLTIHNRLTSASANAGDNRGAGVSGLGEIRDDVSLVIDLRGESDNNETASSAHATNNSSNYLNNQNGGSESDMITSGPQPAVSENIELTSGSSDECEFVLERKPPHLRTPEMVSLDSASDSDVVFVEESKPLNKTSFSSSEEELNDRTDDHKQKRRQNNKLAALVQAKKRNQSSNLVKSEQHDSHSDVYNMGASTSAALRLSIQKRAAKSQRAEAASSSKRPRRDKYSLRNNDNQSRTERRAPKRRGKRLDSEDSYSNTSSSSATMSSSSTNESSTSKSSSSSSDEDYVASFHRKRMAGNTSTHKGGKVRKTKKRKASNSKNDRTSKRDSVKRRTNVYSSEEEGEEEEEGLRGKNYSLIMSVYERRKRQNQKNHHKDEEYNPEEESEGENSWRLKAVNDILRKQQQEKAKSSQKCEERKRSRRSSAQQQSNEVNSSGKRQKYENQNHQENEKAMNIYNSEDTSSDESDNINLIQLKTKLTGKDNNKNANMEQTRNTNMLPGETATNTMYQETTAPNDNYGENDTNTTDTTTIPNADFHAARKTASQYTAIPSNLATVKEEAHCSRSNNELSTSPSTYNNIENTNLESLATKHQSFFNFSDESSDYNRNVQQPNDKNNQESLAQHEQQQQNLLSSSSPNRNHSNQDNLENPLQIQDDNVHDEDDDNANAANFCDDDEINCNVQTNMNITESNVFVDGTTSMSTTTTDTILHEAAEQISSAAVNFYNPQQIFNTADFADENSTNSSSSDTSVSSSSSSLTSSSNSSSNNTYNYNTYDRS